MRKDAAKDNMTVRRIGEIGLKHSIWLMIAWWTGGAWVLYFADAPTLVKELATFQAPFVAYLWIGILTFTTYVLAGHMREQVCLYMCPWPRIQAALTDEQRTLFTRVAVFRGGWTAEAAEQVAGATLPAVPCSVSCASGHVTTAESRRPVSMSVRSTAIMGNQN